MKVSKWKILGIAGALVLSYAVASDAAQIKVDDDTFADLGFWMKVRYNNFDDRADSDTATLSKPDYSRNVFDVVDARFNIEGQINNIVQFYGEVVTSGAYSSGVYDVVGISGRGTNAKLSEGGINLVFLPELQLRLGKIRIPFTRDQQEARYSYIVQTDWLYDPHGLFSYWKKGLLRLMDGGAVLHGELAKGMLRYDVGVFNQASDDEPLNSVAWAARLEFTPTMLGFNAETKTSGRGWLHDTYLGKKGDILSIGVGYFTQDVAVSNATYNVGTVSGGALLPGVSSSLIASDTSISTLDTLKELDVDAWTVDAFLEKRFGCAVINLEAAYVNWDDSHLASDGDKEDSYYWYAKGQILYDQVVGIGKPALYVKYDYIEADNMYNNDDFEMTRWGVGVNYYIAGNAARLIVGMDNVSYDDGAEDYLDVSSRKWEDNITDWFVQAQIMF
ncbi:MAG: Phosphate-selective porin [Thermodesulfobacterium sp.]|uniref:Phosphate-selective porin n=1 Tax=Candidatus Thermodesulfobacterium syntrophicum TaxID=3060442 RepID=A0AAE3P5T9_9BACT|nr:Phosphate-selective porin [Candidatus Thermodesulfobacterium syntrophicum]